jgi:hypothetical protein
MDKRPISAEDLKLALARDTWPELLHEFLKVPGVLYFGMAASFQIGFAELVETSIASRHYLDHVWLQIEDASHEHWWLFSRWTSIEQLSSTIDHELDWTSVRTVVDRARNRRKHDRAI